MFSALQIVGYVVRKLFISLQKRMNRWMQLFSKKYTANNISNKDILVGPFLGNEELDTSKISIHLDPIRVNYLQTIW